MHAGFSVLAFASPVLPHCYHEYNCMRKCTLKKSNLHCLYCGTCTVCNFLHITEATTKPTQSKWKRSLEKFRPQLEKVLSEPTEDGSALSRKLDQMTCTVPF